MIKINIICIGKLKEKYLKEGINEYLKRISPYAKVNIIELDEYKLPNNPSKSQIKQGLSKEGNSILSNFGKSYIIGLCIEGKKLSSELFAEKIKNILTNSSSEISFIIGSSFGLSDEVKQKCSLTLSVSDMTFPHQLMRLILCEQIYRNFQILNNSKYHK